MEKSGKFLQFSFVYELVCYFLCFRIYFDCMYIKKRLNVERGEYGIIKMHAIQGKDSFPLQFPPLRSSCCPCIIVQFERISADSQGRYLPHLTPKPVNLNQLSR